MAFVSVTRLRIRSIFFMPAFMVQTTGVLSQTRAADGFLGGSLLPDRKRTFWTLTLWRDEAAMRQFLLSGPHLKVMPKLMAWCDEASVAHWTQAAAALPSWSEADRRMRAEGRPSKVRRPSVTHRDLAYDAPMTARATPISPR